MVTILKLFFKQFRRPLISAPAANFYLSWLFFVPAGLELITSREAVMPCNPLPLAFGRPWLNKTGQIFPCFQPPFAPPLFSSNISNVVFV